MTEQSRGKLTGRVVLITGGANGQGAAEARLFASEGAAVVLTDIEDDVGAEVVASILAVGGHAVYCHHDVASETDWIAAIAVAKLIFGGLHVLINNAGTIARLTTDSVTLDGWNRTIAVNLTGPMLGIKHAAPVIRDAGGGAIVNVSSTAGLTAHYDPAYTASKWGLRGLTKTAATEYAPWGIRVNSIHPGQISNTTFQRRALPGLEQSLLASIPMQRAGLPEECANLALFLSCDDSSFITGAEVAIDGGYAAGATMWMRSRLREKLNAEPDVASVDAGSN